MTRAEELVALASSRSAQKRWGTELDRDPDLRRQVVELARRRGVDLPEDAFDWVGKKLLRRAQGRADASQIRTNPIARDEDFECIGCGKHVPAHGRTARDHCPFCLAGRHVDGPVPGDRASSCGERLDPIRAVVKDGRWRIHYRCSGCGAERVNQAILDGDVPDDWPSIVALASKDA